MYDNRVTHFFLASLIALAASACNDRELTGLSDFRPVHEVHLQGGGNIDVLWVIDNSGSMKEEQTKLGQNFSEFVSYFYGLEYDFQMAVITTDLEDSSMQGRFQGNPKILDPDTPNLYGTFVQTVNVGTGGHKREHGLEASKRALSEPLLSGHNSGFLREGALLAVVVVTDEDDGGSEDDRPPMPPVADYVEFFNDLKGDSSLFSLSVIAGDIPNGCESSAAKAAPGYRYHEIVQATGGTIESICQEDFGPVLQRLGEVITGYQAAYEMSQVPSDDTLTVAVDDLILDQGVAWTYDVVTNSVVFASDYIPEGCSQVQIDYWVPAAPGNTDPITVIGNPDSQTCPPVDLPKAILGSSSLNGGAIAACSISDDIRFSPARGIAAILFLLAIGLLAHRQRRKQA